MENRKIRRNAVFIIFHTSNLPTHLWIKNINLILKLALHETLKILPQKPDPIVIEQIAEHLGSIGAIHQTQPELNPG